MPEPLNISYLAVVLADVDGTAMVCIASTDGGQTHSHCMSAAIARNYAKALGDAADALDPLPDTNAPKAKRNR